MNKSQIQELKELKCRLSQIVSECPTLEDAKLLVKAAESALANAKDREAGRRDCRFGIYDKWYRYNHKDEGKAYNDGWVEQNQITQNEKVTFLEG